MVGDVTKPSGEGGDKEEDAKHPHDADLTVAAFLFSTYDLTRVKMCQTRVKM